ncbi:phage tail assembly chaperone G [Bacillus haynesii]|uniref:phage tail assembly chaperone G n=1 Tax=Bacillus haynesii TaxID=1925021 RepID=UPI0035DC388F
MINYKTFIAPRTNSKTLYEALELDEAAAKNTNSIKEVHKSLENRMKFIVRVFHNQFTLEDFFMIINPLLFKTNIYILKQVRGMLLWDFNIAVAYSTSFKFLDQNHDQNLTKNY